MFSPTTIATKPVLATIGWTKSDRANDYISYCDGFKTGAEQYSLDLLLEVPADYDVEKVAWLALTATNSPSVDPDGHSFASAVLRAIYAQGYHGKEAGHFSLSVGDTVTVGETTVAFTGYAVEVVTL